MTDLSVRELSRTECLALLRTATTGQVALTRRALPTVFPARFIVGDDRVIVHLSTGVRPLPWRDGEIVALHVCRFDDDETRGWSVSVTGAAHGVEEVALEACAPHAPWIARGGGELIVVPTEIVSGERLTADPTGHMIGPRAPDAPKQLGAATSQESRSDAFR